MRKNVILLSVVLFTLAVTSRLAEAAITVAAGNYITIQTDGGAIREGNGGEFKVTVYAQATGGSALGTFYTFCAELDQTFTPGTTRYFVDDVVFNPNTMGHTLSDYGRWVYWQYRGASPATQVLPTHTSLSPNNLTAAKAGAIQTAIWKEMGYTDTEINNSNMIAHYTTYNPAWQSAYDTMSSSDQEIWDFAKRHVGIAQISLKGVEKQDQMVLTFDSLSVPVPEPASVFVWSLLGLSATCICVFRRHHQTT